jgi:hypothetical protein
MVAQSTVIAYEPIKSIDSSTFTGSYQAIGSASTHPCRIFKIVNDSNMAVTISTDGTTDQDFLPAGTFVLYDLGTNRGNPASEACLPPTQFYAKGSSGTGLVYVVILYANTPHFNIPF